MKKILLLTGLFVGLFISNSFSQCGPMANAGPDQNACSNDTIQLFAAPLQGTATGTWSTTGSGSFSNPNDTIAVYYSDFSDTSTVFMIWSVDSAGACFDADTMLVNFGTVDVWINGPSSVCEGDSITITANGANNYTWDNGLGTGASHTILPASTTTYTVIGNNGMGCTATDQITVTVNPQLTVPDAGADQNLCTTSTTLSANTISSGVGIWRVVQGGANISDTLNPSSFVSALQTGDNILTWSAEGNGCTTMIDSVLIHVVGSLTVPYVGPDMTLCESEGFINLSANSVGAGETGTWSVISGSGVFADANDPNTEVTGLSGTTVLQWTINSGVCPASSDAITITSGGIAAAAVSISPGTSVVCLGSNIYFQANPVNGGSGPSYQWYQDGNPVGSSTDTFSVYNITTPTEIVVELTSNSPCANPLIAYDTIQITVENPVDANVQITASKSTICGSEPIKFTITTADNMGDQPIYYWLLNNSLVAQNTLSVTLANLSNGDVLDLVAGSNYSCIADQDDTSSITMSVVGGNNIATDFIHSTCTQANGTLLLNGLTPSTSVTYSVYKDGVKITAPSIKTTDGSGTLILSGYSAGMYSVDISSGGCTASYPIDLNDTTDLTVTVGTTIATCESKNGRAWPLVSGGVAPYTYVWNNGRIDSLVNNLGSGSYSVTVIDGQGCKQIVEVEIQDSCDVTAHGLVKGFVFDDINGDGVKQPNEKGLGGIRINIGPYYTYTNPAGHYIAHVPYGSYNVIVVAPTVYSCGGYNVSKATVSVPVSGSYSVTLNTGSKQSFNNDFGLISPDEVCGEICGMVFEDINGNGVRDGMEMGMPSVRVVLQGNGLYRTINTNLSGEYCFEVPVNAGYQISLNLNNSNYSYYCSASSSTQVQTTPAGAITAASPSTNNIFGVQKSNSFDVSIYSVRPPTSIRPGQCFRMYMDVKMSGPITEACTLTVTHDPLVTINSAWLQPTSIAPGVTTWIFPTGTYIPFECFSIYGVLSSSATQGQTLTFTGQWSCQNGDACASNNTLTTIRTVKAPYSKTTSANAPNNMEVIHTGDESTGDITVEDTTFSYVINYQHVGEDTVFSMTIIDTLPAGLNINTISTPFSSDGYIMSIVEPNIVIFEFNDLMLIGSDLNELESYGFIQYNIIAETGIAIDDVIENSATILFNNTDEIKTNITSNKVVGPNATEDQVIEAVLKLFPNPTSG